MNPTQKLQRVLNLCKELMDEDNEVIVTARLEGLAKEFCVSPFQCALIYCAMKDRAEFISLFGSDVKVRFRLS